MNESNKSLDLSNKRDVAIAVKAIRKSESGGIAHQTLMANVVWSLHQFTNEVDLDEVEVTDSEVEQIFNELPTDFETEEETDD